MEKKITKLLFSSLLNQAGIALTGLLLVLFVSDVTAQNVFSGEPVQWVGRPNGYSTTPYNSDYRTTVYRKVSTTASNPTDGRGQWSTTINVQSSGGDIAPDNMPGGGGAGWLLISGPSTGRFNNKWNFNGVGQGALNAINAVILQGGGQDMGLNMGTTGRYTFNMRDAGYANTEFYVGYTANTPVTVTHTGQSFSAGNSLISITTSATPSTGENIYIRYRANTNDFSTGTLVVQATGSGTSWTGTIPQQSCGSTIYYYAYSSTRTLVQINSDSESDRALGAIRYDDNSGANYSYTLSPPTAGITNNTGTTILTCTTASINLTATGVGSYLWDDASTSSARNVAAAGTYTVTVTAANGCTASAQTTITTDNTPPTVSASALPATICVGNSSSLTASGAGAYTWMPGSLTGTTVSVSPGVTTTYTVTGTAGNGCTATATVTVTVNPNPIIATSMKSDASFVTVGTAGITTVPAGSSFLWSPGGQTTNYIENQPPGTYMVTVTSPGGCVKTKSIIIN